MKFKKKIKETKINPPVLAGFARKVLYLLRISMGFRMKQRRIDGNPVSDGWARAVMRKTLKIQNYYGQTDRSTDTARGRVACPRLKMKTFISVPMACFFKDSYSSQTVLLPLGKAVVEHAKRR